jgi:hypothetical protein
MKNGAEMDTQLTINEIYNRLSDIGIVDTKKEFYRDWLNRGESYFRCLKQKNKQPSADTLAICSSKLKHYSTLLQQKNQHQYSVLAKEFSAYSSQLDTLIFNNSKTKWLELMEEDKERTLH